MEDSSLTEGPVKPANSGDVSDILCESLLSLFEYVDDVTKSFNEPDDDKNIDVAEDILDGRLRQADGFDRSMLNRSNGEKDAPYKKEEKRLAEDDEVIGSDHSKQTVNSYISDIGSSPCLNESNTDIEDKVVSGSDNESCSDISDKVSNSVNSDSELLVTYSEVCASDDTDGIEVFDDDDDDRTVIVINSSAETLDDNETDKTIIGAVSMDISKDNDNENATDRTIIGAVSMDISRDVENKNVTDNKDLVIIMNNEEQKEIRNDESINCPKQKKRNLSFKADSETTPKRLKNIESTCTTPAILSPIQNTPSLRKGGILETILEETPIIYRKTSSLDNDRAECVSSTPLHNNTGEKKANVRKVFWKGNGDKKTEDGEKLSISNENIKNSNNSGKEMNDNRRVVCKNITTSNSCTMQELNVGDKDKMASNREKHETTNWDIGNTILSTSNVSIYDSSYFAENTTRTEGRFKNVTATISNIDLELDEDLLLTEDVLGLEGDYEDDSPDEDTLLAGDDQQVLSETGETSNTPCYPFNRTVVIKTTNSVPEIKVKPVEIGNIIEKGKGKLKVTEAFDIEAKEPQNDSNRKVIDATVGKEIVSISSDTDDIQSDKENHEASYEVIEILDDTVEVIEKKDADKDGSEAIRKSETCETTTVEAKSVERNEKTSLYKTKEQMKHVSPQALGGSSKLNQSGKRNVSPKNKTSPISERAFIYEEKENAVMEEVKCRWGCEGIPSQEVNLTMATTYHDNHDSMMETTALLEGEKISCLNFYENELTTRHQSLKYRSAQQTQDKLRKQKQDLDNMKLMTLQAFEQNCYRRCRFLKRRHIDEFEHMKMRHQMEYHDLRYCPNLMPFVKQQQLVQLGINHAAERRRLDQHQQMEFDSLSHELQESLKEDTKLYEQEVAPVEMLISQVESIDRTAAKDKYGPSVTVTMKKRPCKENNYKTSTVEVCLPVVIAQELSHEEDIYNHFYKFEK